MGAGSLLRLCPCRLLHSRQGPGSGGAVPRQPWPECSASLQQPQPLGVEPKQGPQAGGTTLTISGTHLDTGSEEDVRVTLSGVPCKVWVSPAGQRVCGLPGSSVPWPCQQPDLLTLEPGAGVGPGAGSTLTCTPRLQDAVWGTAAVCHRPAGGPRGAAPGGALRGLPRAQPRRHLHLPREPGAAVLPAAAELCQVWPVCPLPGPARRLTPYPPSAPSQLLLHPGLMRMWWGRSGWRGASGKPPLHPQISCLLGTPTG